MAKQLPLLERMSIGSKVREDFYRALAKTADEGLPQVEVLEVLKRNFVKTKHPLLPLISEVLGRIRGKSGGSRADLKTIGTELAGLVPDSESLLIQAGEDSGMISQGYRNAADYIGAKRHIQATILSSMLKPFGYIAGFIGLMLFFSFNIIPAFEKSKPRHLWPENAALLGWMADNVLVLTGAIIAVVVGGSLLIGVLAGRWTGDLRDSFDKNIPPFSLIAQVQAANLFTALAGFVSAGIPFSDAVAKVRAGASIYMRWQCDRINSRMRMGKRPEECLISLPMVNKRYHWIIEVYGMGADSGGAYRKIANEMREQVLGRVSMVFTKIIANVCLLILAGGIVFVYFGMMSIANSEVTPM